MIFWQWQRLSVRIPSWYDLSVWEFPPISASVNVRLGKKVLLLSESPIWSNIPLSKYASRLGVTGIYLTDAYILGYLEHTTYPVCRPLLPDLMDLLHWGIEWILWFPGHYPLFDLWGHPSLSTSQSSWFPTLFQSQSENMTIESNLSILSPYFSINWYI